MKLFRFFLLMSGVSATAIAQDIDAVKSRLQQHVTEDSIRVELLTDLCAALTFSQPDSVFSYAEEAKRISEKIGYHHGRAIAINCQGMAIYQKGDRSGASTYYFQAKDIAERYNDVRALFVILNNIAIIYNGENKFDEALTMHYRQLELLGQSPSPYNLAAVYNNIGSVYGAKNDFLEGMRWFSKVDSICIVHHIPMGSALSRANIGQNLIRLGRPAEAIAHLEFALKLALSLNLTHTITASYRTLGDAHLTLQNLQKAKDYYQKGAALAKKENILSEAMSSYEGLAKTHERLRDFANAFTALNASLFYKDSLLTIQKAASLQELITKYETEKKELTIREQTEKLKVQELESARKNLIIMTVLIIFAAVAVATAFYVRIYRQKKKHEMLQMELEQNEKRRRLEVDLIQSELKGIKAQMNPHFIYNVLNSIQSFVYANRKNDASEYLTKFSDMMRKALELSGQSSISLKEEMEALELYLEMERLCMGEEMSFVVQAEDTLDIYSTQIPSMIVQPFAENAVKHGLLHKTGERKLFVRFRRENKILVVEIEDNGIGREAAGQINSKKISKPKSFATEAVANRIELLNRTLVRKITTETLDKVEHGEPVGTRVRIQIPME